MKISLGFKLSSLFVFVIGITGILSATGFCFSQFRYLSDEKFIENAIKYRAEFINGLPRNPTKEDVVLYIKNNPKCCRIESSKNSFGESPSFPVFGQHTRWVRIVHLLRDDHQNQSEGKYSDVYIGMDDCGVISRQVGQHYSRGPIEIDSIDRR